MPESYRIGEWLQKHGGGSNPPDGEHIAHVQSMDLTATKDNKPQFKVVTHLLDLNNRQYTYYYPLWEEMLWKLFQDTLAAGAASDFDPGPPGPQWLEKFRPGFVNRTFRIKLATKGDFQNVSIVGVEDAGVTTVQPPTKQPKPAPSGFPAGGNAPTPVQAASTWTGMQPNGPAKTEWGGGAGATEGQMVDAASLFKNA